VVPGGAELRVAAPRRKYIVAGLVLMTAFAAWKSTALWTRTPVTHIALWCGLTLLLVLATVWCALGDETWVLQSGQVTHRIGIRSWSYKRQLEHAELEVVLDFSTHFNVPSYRLYAVIDGQPHFLFERRQPDLHLLAAFVSFYTGWPIRPASLMPFRSLVPGGNS
jgi:hypothetical protein